MHAWGRRACGGAKEFPTGASSSWFLPAPAAQLNGRFDQADFFAPVMEGSRSWPQLVSGLGRLSYRDRTRKAIEEADFTGARQGHGCISSIGTAGDVVGDLSRTILFQV